MSLAVSANEVIYEAAIEDLVAIAIRHREIVSAIIRILIASEAVALRHLSSASAIALNPGRIVLIAVLRGAIARALTLIATAPRVIAVAFALIAIAMRAVEIANGATAFSTCEKMSGFTLSPKILSQLESLRRPVTARTIRPSHGLKKILPKQ
jgi:hypothetical protein